MRNLRYNELDEIDWELKNGVYDGPYGDECWDEVVLRNLHEDEPDGEPVEDEETGQGIFGNELNHEQSAQNGHCTCISNGTVYGHGEKDEIERVVFNLLEPFKDYHFEFKFFEAK